MLLCGVYVCLHVSTYEWYMFCYVSLHIECMWCNMFRVCSEVCIFGSLCNSDVYVYVCVLCVNVDVHRVCVCVSVWYDHICV